MNATISSIGWFDAKNRTASRAAVSDTDRFLHEIGGKDWHAFCAPSLQSHVENMPGIDSERPDSISHFSVPRLTGNIAESFKDTSIFPCVPSLQSHVENMPGIDSERPDSISYFSVPGLPGNIAGFFTGPSIFPRAVLSRPWDADTREEFNGIDVAAEEEGYEPPPSHARESAEKILTALNDKFPEYYAVSPMADSSVGIYAQANGRGFLVSCNADGSGTCIMTQKSAPNVIRKSRDISEPSGLDAFIRHVLRQFEEFKYGV